MKHNPNSLAEAIRFALGAGLVASLAMTAAPVWSQDADEDEEAADVGDRITVTGSRIKRIDAEGALPVTVIDREAIELSGESNAADLIRSIPFNTSGSFRPQSGSSAQAVSEIGLRGLGASRTLVLVNGRRMPLAPLTGASADLNMIPMGAIERIEILTDGASAVYGSDAIGGVVNVVLRSDFEGAEIMAGVASVEPKGGDRKEAYATFGTSSDTTSIIGGASYNQRDIIFARDFFFVNPGASIYGNNFTTIDSDGFDLFNWTALPNACSFSNQPAFYINQTAGSLTGESCAYDFTRVSADEASVTNQSIFLRADHEFADDWNIYSDMWVAKTRSFGRYAPVPDSSFFNTPVTPNSINNPTNPDSPMFDPSLGLEPQDVNVWHRFDALGNRDNFVDSELYDLVLGVRGMIGEVEVEAGARWTRNKVFDIGYNYLVRSTAYNFIEDGIYELFDPFGAPDSVLNAMKATVSRISKFDQNQFYANAAFDLGEINDAPISWFVGTEFRDEIYDDQYDSLSEAGQIGGSSGNSAGGQRDVSSLFGEVLIPAFEGFELSLAARYDDYSDYGSDFSPKVSFRYEPIDGYVFRASWGEGFRAPDFPSLTQAEAFSADSVADPQSCINQGQPQNCTLQVNAFRIANPDLGSEQSEQFALGFAFQPVDWFSGTLDYADIEITDRINFFSSQELINLENAGDPTPAGLGVTRSPNGSIVRIDTGFGNEGVVETSFLDLNLRANWGLDAFQFSHNLNVVQVLSQSVDGGRDTVRDPGVPEIRAVLTNTVNWGDFSGAYNINYIDDQCDTISAGECVGRVPTYVTHDAQVNYFTPWNGRITVGARNLWGRTPPIGLGNIGDRDYDFNLYDAFGRVTYVRYTQSF
ncbi:MAG: TonB-dependent receptor [Wenzhouxiangella sp.]|jgi:iron complex outermembrane receptor protein|nr:TonB-dependent receptor [Wenzhouxiangella sp.]